MTRRSFIRILMFALLILTTAIAPAQAVKTSSDLTGFAKEAYKFISITGDKALIVFTIEDKSERYAEIEKLFEDSFDINHIARFTIGRFWKKMSKYEQQQFMEDFKPYILATYTSQQWKTEGLDFTVLDSVPVNSKTVKVETIVQGMEEEQSVSIIFHVKKTENGLKIIDVLLEGVSIGITQRNSFERILNRNDEDFEAFLTILENYAYDFQESMEE